jgi:hypothetical protein
MKNEDAFESLLNKYPLKTTFGIVKIVVYFVVILTVVIVCSTTAYWFFRFCQNKSSEKVPSIKSKTQNVSYI